MTREEAALAYERISEELELLHSSASSHISRRDNNWQFNVYQSLKYVARGYDVGEYKGGGCHAEYEPPEEPEYE